MSTAQPIIVIEWCELQTWLSFRILGCSKVRGNAPSLKVLAVWGPGLALVFLTPHIPGLGRSPGGGHGNPLQDSYLENPHGQRSLAGYSPCGQGESSTTEQPSTAQHSDPHVQPGLRATHLCLRFSVLRNGNNTEVQTLGPYPRPAESDTLGWGPVICVFPSPGGDQNLWALQEGRERSFQESKCFESSLSQEGGTPASTSPPDAPPRERPMVSHSILSLRLLRHGAASGVPSTLWSWFWLSSVLKLVQSAGDSIGERHVPFQLLPPQTCPAGEADRLSGRKFISARYLLIPIYWNQVPETLP